MGDAPAMGDRSDENIAYAAGAAAPPAPPGGGRVEDEVEVEFGVPFVPPPDDAELTHESYQAEMARPKNVTAATTTPAAPTPPVAAPTAPSSLRSEDGRVVSVVHIVAELAPFARTGGLGEAVKSLAEFQSASGIPTAIIMPLYRQVHAVAPNLEPVGQPFAVHLGAQP